MTDALDLENGDLPTFSVTVEGAPLPPRYLVNAVEVFHGVNRIPYARLVIQDGDPSRRDFPISADGVFRAGVTVSVSLGYHGNETEVFRGLVASQRIHYSKVDGALLTVEAQHRVVQLTAGRQNRVWAEQDDLSTLEELLSPAGSVVPGEGVTAGEPGHSVQYYASDWDYAVIRAEANGWLLTPSPDGIRLGPPSVTGEPVVTATFGLNILDFSLDQDATTQTATVKATAWDYTTQTPLSAMETAGEENRLGETPSALLAEALGTTPVQLQSSANLGEAALLAWAKGQNDRAQLAKIRGYVMVEGTAELSPDGLIGLAGFGGVFDGSAYVSTVEHVLRDGNWTTRVEVGLDPEIFAQHFKVEAPAASGVIPASRGLMTGIVKQVSDDPAGSHRVQVQVPILAESDFIWARLSTFYASSETGAVFYPELEDEVVIAFVNEDPRDAVILGSVYNPEPHMPPLTVDLENQTKGIVTRSKNKIEFQDGPEGPSIVISTPGNRTITLNDKEQLITISDDLGNTISMNESGISMESENAISLKAGSSVSVEAGGEISLEAAESLSGEAGTVSMTGAETLSLTGGAEASLEGALVRIN